MNYYQILNISPTASLKDIKKAYHKLALQYHPDKNNNSEESTEQFKLISVAYQVLSDPTQRSYYDNTGQTNMDFDLMTSIELFKVFFKDYNPKIINIIEKTYDRLHSEFKDNANDSILNAMYNIEKADILKDVSHLALNYLNDYMNTRTSQSKQTTKSKYTYNIHEISPVTDIILPIEYYMNYNTVDISIVVQEKTYPLSLQTIFHNHNISFQDTQMTFKLLDKPHSIYKRINQYDILMNINIGLKDYIDGFQFTYNYINTNINVPILLSKHASNMVQFKNYGLPRDGSQSSQDDEKKQDDSHDKKNCGYLLIEFNIQIDIERLYDPPQSDAFIYSTPLKNIL